MAETVEPWLRGTLTEFDAVRRQVLHALILTEEDCVRWCLDLSDAELEARPSGLPSVGFHMRHIVRSLDRLLTYAQGYQLREIQRAALESEMVPDPSRAHLFEEFRTGLAAAATRIKAIPSDTLEYPRGVGRDSLPSTVGGLLVHCAEHTQRHSGQMITTARVLLAARS